MTEKIVFACAPSCTHAHVWLQVNKQTYYMCLGYLKIKFLMQFILLLMWKSSIYQHLPSCSLLLFTGATCDSGPCDMDRVLLETGPNAPTNFTGIVQQSDGH